MFSILFAYGNLLARGVEDFGHNDGELTNDTLGHREWPRNANL